MPGSPGVLNSPEEALELAAEIGYPVILKASAGGGGRGMRVAVNEQGLRTAFMQAQAEAQAAFGCGDVYLEHYVEHPRHRINSRSDGLDG